MKRIRWMRETHPYPALLWRSGGILMIAGLVVMALGFFPTHSALAASISGSPFTSPGEHSFVVPAGVTSLQVVTIGGAGGTGGTECNCQGTGAAGGSGGQGAMVTTTVAVTAGSTLWVEVGSNGANGANDPSNSDYTRTDAGGAGGTNGGGAGGTSINFYGGGGGGGGYSALRVCPLSGTGCPSNPWLVVAGGGGGGAGGGTLYNGFGGNGGTPNGANGLSGSPGTGGSQTAPGSGGPASGGYSAGSNGSETNGGVGSNVGSGGGGGGYYGGGGGGGYSSGGGGGSSYGPSNATYTKTTNAPSVDMTYDNTAPTLQLPSTITTNATSAAGAPVNYTVTATDPDNAPSDLTISCSPASGSTFAIGTSTVNCSASDPAGNTTTGSFQVVVKDVSPPTLQLPSTITTDATSAAGATVNYTVTATDPDNAPSDLTISCSPASGSTFAIGTSTVNCSASDPAGNTTTGSFQVVVNDVPPTLHLPSTITTNATSAAGATVNYTVTATDPIYSASQLTISCSPASGSTFAIGTTTVNCSVTDLAGTTVTGSFQVVVQGAATQTSNLITTVNSFHLAMSLQTALDAKLNAALKAINAGQTATACSDLSDFIGQVQAKIGKGITQSQANQLIAAAKQVQAVLGC